MVDDPGRSVADRGVKFRYSVENLSRDTFIFPRTTHQVMVVVVEGCEYVVTIFVGFDALAPPRRGKRSGVPSPAQ